MQRTIFSNAGLTVIETAEGSYIVRSAGTNYPATNLTQAFAFVQSLARGETPDPTVEARFYTPPVEQDWKKPRMHR